MLELQAAVDYRVPAGSVSFRVRPAWPGGHLILPLGPAGELSLRTHHTPVDVVMDYRLPSQTAALLGGASGDDVPRLEGGAREAFSRYLLGRVPWLLLVGAAAGLLVAGHQTRRRRLWGIAGGAAAALLLGGALVLASFATLDRSPAVRYSGLASKVPSVLPLLRALSTGGDQSDRLSRLQDFLDGLESVATQLTNEPRRTARAGVVRLLLASDIHDNVFGARAAARLAAGGGEPVDAVLLAGDVTDRGSAQEAQLFLRVFGPRPWPVLFVGGNHEDAPALRVFRRAGFHILNDTTVYRRRRHGPGRVRPGGRPAPGGLRRGRAHGCGYPARRPVAPAAPATAGGARARRPPGRRHHRLRAGGRDALWWSPTATITSPA